MKQGSDGKKHKGDVVAVMVDLGEDNLETVSSVHAVAEDGKTIVIVGEALDMVREMVGEKANKFGVLVKPMVNPDSARRERNYWFARNANQVIRKVDFEGEMPQSSDAWQEPAEPTVETPESPPAHVSTTLTERRKRVLAPLGRQLSRLLDVVEATDEATEIIVAGRIEATGLSALVSTQEEEARGAKAQFMEVIAEERAEALLTRLLSLLRIHGDRLVMEARQAGLVAIFQELAVLEEPTEPDPYDPADAERWRVPEPETRQPKSAEPEEGATPVLEHLVEEQPAEAVAVPERELDDTGTSD